MAHASVITDQSPHHPIATLFPEDHDDESIYREVNHHLETLKLRIEEGEATLLAKIEVEAEIGSATPRAEYTLKL
ncbi:MAG: hypothetical protein ACREIW_03805, partial [Chthoniobacterales bacterium]